MRWLLAGWLPLLAGCVTTRQDLTAEGGQVHYVPQEHDPSGCKPLGEVSVGKEWFVFDERTPAVSREDTLVRLRNLAAKLGGNLVVVDEIKAPHSECNGFSGAARVYLCPSDSLPPSSEPP